MVEAIELEAVLIDGDVYGEGRRGSGPQGRPHRGSGPLCRPQDLIEVQDLLEVQDLNVDLRTVLIGPWPWSCLKSSAGAYLTAQPVNALP